MTGTLGTVYVYVKAVVLSLVLKGVLKQRQGCVQGGLQSLFTTTFPLNKHFIHGLEHQDHLKNWLDYHFFGCPMSTVSNLSAIIDPVNTNTTYHARSSLVGISLRATHVLLSK